jgi:transposase
MDHVGIDVHKKESQVCILTQEGEVVEVRIATTRERLREVLGGRPRCRILLEAATESEWVARCLEGQGHEVIVGDPNYAPMYGTRTRRVKTDQRDARAPAEACRLGIYRPSHRRSEEQRHVTARLAVRDALVQSRTKFICLVRALLRRESMKALRRVCSNGSGVRWRRSTGRRDRGAAGRPDPRLVSPAYAR